MGVEVVQEVIQLEAIVVVIFTSKIEGLGEEVLWACHPFSKAKQHCSLTATWDIPPGLLVQHAHPRAAKVNLGVEGFKLGSTKQHGSGAIDHIGLDLAANVSQTCW